MVWHKRPQFSCGFKGRRFKSIRSSRGPLWPTQAWPQEVLRRPRRAVGERAVQPPRGPSGKRRSTHGLVYSKKNPQVPFIARRALLCFLVCLFLNILAVERESLFCFSPPHMLYSFPSSTRFLLTQLTIVCLSHRNASCVCPQIVS